MSGTREQIKKYLSETLGIIKVLRGQIGPDQGEMLLDVVFHAYNRGYIDRMDETMAMQKEADVRLKAAREANQLHPIPADRFAEFALEYLDGRLGFISKDPAFKKSRFLQGMAQAYMWSIHALRNRWHFNDGEKK
jgi:hypothetical protein